ncbi:MAG: hypothetical protein KGL19_01690 [Bacteroidota bacterium]|nr:hypothetical protein [Bacteroidota bacterium]
MIVSALLFVIHLTSSAQTDQDAIMMSKNNLCSGLMYGHSSWTNYWEGTFKRDNPNLGTVSTSMLSVMGNYGINRRLNIIFALPYVQTKATQGTLHGMKGIQDISAWIKWMPIEKDFKKGTVSLYVLGGTSIPTSNYVADFLPLSIGLHSKTLSGRIILDYQRGAFFATGSATYTYRSNVTIDRTSYYTTTLILSNQVQMPDVMGENFRIGYRSNYLIAEAVVSNMTTLSGFDIRKNDMPFLSNKMNATTAGINFKYTLKKLSALAITGGADYTVAGRNVGQSTNLNIGAFYVLDFTHKKKDKK